MAGPQVQGVEQHPLGVAPAEGHRGGWANDDQHKDGPKVKVSSQKDGAEMVDGKKARATTVEVTLAPGQASALTATPARCSAT